MQGLHSCFLLTVIQQIILQPHLLSGEVESSCMCYCLLLYFNIKRYFEMQLVKTNTNGIFLDEDKVSPLCYLFEKIGHRLDGEEVTIYYMGPVRHGT